MRRHPEPLVLRKRQRHVSPGRQRYFRSLSPYVIAQVRQHIFLAVPRKPLHVKLHLVATQRRRGRPRDGDGGVRRRWRRVMNYRLCATWRRWAFSVQSGQRCCGPESALVGRVEPVDCTDVSLYIAATDQGDWFCFFVTCRSNVVAHFSHHVGILGGAGHSTVACRPQKQACFTSQS